MSTKNKTRTGKARPGFVRANWRERVHPAFLAWWSARKKNRGLRKIKDKREQEQKFNQWFQEASAASRAINKAMAQTKYPGGAKISSAILRRLDIEGPLVVPVGHDCQGSAIYPQNPESSDLFRMILFLRCGITFRELIRQIDVEQSSNAYRKLSAARRDYWRLCSGVDFNDFKWKFHYDHFGIIVQGSDFGFDKLTPDELAECLDEICPCAQKHSPDYLKKLRTRIKKACNLILESGTD